MKNLRSKIERLDKKIIIEYLNASGDKQQALFELSKNIRNEIFGNKVWFRGLIEFSNICQNDCYYCGIRKSNFKNERFTLSEKEILDCLNFINEVSYGSVVYQSGEVLDKKMQDYIFRIVELTHKEYPEMAITLSCGELSYEQLEKLREAGASRYLLRIETSNPEFYRKLHPENMSWENRLKCLKDLQSLDYQTGTGVMVGLPGQNDEDLLNDLKFFINNKFDMFGIGPYVVHQETPFGQDEKIVVWWEENKEKNFNKFLNFIALLRIINPKINIAAATACDVFDSLGRIKVLEIAGNVIMPSVTPADYRDKYLLYQNKPGVDDNADKSREKLANKLVEAGLEPAWGELGTSLFYLEK